MTICTLEVMGTEYVRSSTVESAVTVKFRDEQKILTVEKVKVSSSLPIYNDISIDLR